MSINHTLAHELFLHRTALGYTQEEVSEMVDISTRWYQELENGRRIPNSCIFIRLLFVLELDIEVFRECSGLNQNAVDRIKHNKATRKVL